jgi:GNAT superfamily N-acetyltransferase
MAISEVLPIVGLDTDDVEAAMALSTEAGWNQVREDWCHFIEKGRTIGVRNDEGRLVGSAAALPYHGAFGFVGMVLVTAEWRRRGIATRLVDQCVDTLVSQDFVPVLDATEAGEQVYVRQGFMAQFRFDRWQRLSKGDENVRSGTAGGETVDVDRLIELDARAFGARRPLLIRDFLGRKGTRCVMCESGDGFAFVRAGRRALQAGPVVAMSQDAAIALLDRLLETVSQSVFVDVPAVWPGIGAWLTSRGFTIQRSFARMALNRSSPYGHPENLFAVAGPEFG